MRHGRLATRAVLGRFDIQQEQSFQGIGLQHVRRVHAALHRLGFHQLGTHGVGGFTQITHSGTRLHADPIGQTQQAAGFGMVGGCIAQQDGFAFTTQ